jgi:hypothetical protein
VARRRSPVGSHGIFALSTDRRRRHTIVPTEGGVAVAGTF